MKKEEFSEYKEKISQKELDEITLEYDRGDKTKDIIARHNLQISCSQFPNFLPMKEGTQTCPYCNIKMKKRRVRTTYTYYREKEICENCGHEYDEYRTCKCDNCLNYAEREKEKRKRAIFELFSSKIPSEKIPFSELSFDIQAKIYICYTMNAKRKDFSSLREKQITDYIGQEGIKELCDNNIIYISPDADVDDFIWKEKTITPKEQVVPFFFNLSYNDEDVEMFKTKKYKLDRFKEGEIRSNLRDLIIVDLLEFFKEELKKRKIEFKPTTKQLVDFRILLSEASYTEIRYICYRVAVFYSDRITTGDIYRSKAPFQVLASVVNFYHSNIKKYGTSYRSEAEYVTGYLRYFIELVLGENVSILDSVI